MSKITLRRLVPFFSLKQVISPISEFLLQTNDTIAKISLFICENFGDGKKCIFSCAFFSANVYGPFEARSELSTLITSRIGVIVTFFVVIKWDPRPGWGQPGPLTVHRKNVDSLCSKTFSKFGGMGSLGWEPLRNSIQPTSS